MEEEIMTSKQYIELAFLELLEDYEYNDINITMITKKAGVARVTFYRNFNNVEEVLNYVISNLLRDFTQFINIAFAKKDENVLRTFITIFLERIMSSKDKIYKIKKSNKTLIFEKISEKCRNVLIENNIKNLSLREKYDNKIKFAIIASVAAEWASTGFKESISTLSNYLTNILMKI